ncbi:MAG: hypothetical protein QW244_00965 [Candidatus Pacearchaeota archaeon]
MTRKEKIGKKFFLIFSLLALTFFLGCAPQEEKKAGMNINLITGADYASEGKKLFEGEPFKIGLKISNWDPESRQGNICIYDDIADYYGGISQRECQTFLIQGSTTVNNQQVASEQTIIFPKGGSYQYTNIPAHFDFSPRITIETQYLQDSQLSTSLTYPSPETESITLEDKFISLHIEKSIHSAFDNYEIFLRIGISKKGEAVIESERKNNSLRFTISALPLSLTCVTNIQQFSQSALLNLEKENFISCSGLTISREQISLPLIINLKYIAKEERSFNVNVVKRGS